MSKEKHSPTPWRVFTNRFGQNHIYAADGAHVDGPIGGPDKGAGNAALIVETVNDHAKIHEVAANLLRSRDAAIEDGNRLRGLVRRLLPLAEIAEKYADADAEAIKGICALKGVDSSVVDAIREENANLLREAREAIGDGNP